jgi:hypothetical protein
MLYHLPDYDANVRRLPRRGSVSTIVLIAMPVLFLALALALNVARLASARTELHASADAAALAGVQALVDDRMLLHRREIMLDLINQARGEARLYALLNPALGRPVVLAPNLHNDCDGDIVLGTLHKPGDEKFFAADVDNKDNQYLHLINTVRVTARRTRERHNQVKLVAGPLLRSAAVDVVIRATATLDRDVIGFRPQGKRPMPLVPIALLSDPRGQDKKSWEFLVEKRGGSDHWRFDRDKRRFVRDAHGDGLFEMRVRLGTARQTTGKKSGNGPGADPKANACLLQIGDGDIDDLARQVSFGVTRADLSGFLDGQFVLGKDNRLIVPGTPLGPRSRSHLLAHLESCLWSLQRSAEPRIWPLYAGFSSKGMPVLVGFVAARVVDVGSEGKAEGLSFTLQPCMMSTAAAVTDATRRGTGPRSIVNPYICKVRLVDRN